MYGYIKLLSLLVVFFCAQASFAKEIPMLGAADDASIKINTHTGSNNMTDFEAIQNLVVAERIFRVSHRTKELMECYTPDAQIQTSWQSGGRESFVGKHPAEVEKALPIVNRCNPPLININGDRAVVEYPMTTTREVMVNGKKAVLTSFMLLIYQIEKYDGAWKIAKMTSINEYDTLAPVIPGTDLKINPADVKDLRESYRWLAYVRQLAGGTISQDLEGTDRPETVKKVYDSVNTWLFQNNKNN